MYMEVSTSLAKQGRAKALASAFSKFQSRGYHFYRLAHHLHSMEDLESWYTPCIGVRTIKYMLHVANLSDTQWTTALRMSRDDKIGSKWRESSGFPRGSEEFRNIGRTDTATLLISENPLGVGSEAKWASHDSMDLTMPAFWRSSHCGVTATRATTQVETAATDFGYSPAFWTLRLLPAFLLLLGLAAWWRFSAARRRRVGYQPVQT